MKTGVILILVIPVFAIVLGQLGLFSGSAPADLGVSSGKLKPPSKTENSVSSQARNYSNTEYESKYADMKPLPFRGSLKDSVLKIKSVIQNSSHVNNSKLVTEESNYLRYEFQTPLMHYIDDVEFLFSDAEKVIHFRSASRIGRKDLGKNRNRMEKITEDYLKP